MSRPTLARALVVAALLAAGTVASIAARPRGPALDAHDPSLRNANGVWSRDGVSFTGTLTDRDPGTGERTETPFVDGRVDGTVRAWFANGQRMSERRFVRGREEGRHEGWYADGRHHFRYTYRDGVLEGRALEWYPNDTLYRDFTYRAGHEEGPQRMWFPNGTLRANYVMRDGRRFGLPGAKGCTGTGSDSTSAAPVATTAAGATTATAIDDLPFYRSATSGPAWLAARDAERIPRVQPFTLTDQHGATFTEHDVAGTLYVASFFFTTCRGLCPNLYTNLSAVARAFPDAPDLRLLSHTVTPEIDDVSTLAAYAASHHITDPRWHLLTGDPRAIRALARGSYFVQLGDTAGNANGTMVHTETIVLVDGTGHVRGMYDGSLAFDTERLIDDIRTLRAHPAPRG